MQKAITDHTNDLAWSCHQWHQHQKAEEEEELFVWNTHQVVHGQVWFEPLPHDAWVLEGCQPQRRSSHWRVVSGRQRWNWHRPWSPRSLVYRSPCTDNLNDDDGETLAPSGATLTTSPTTTTLESSADAACQPTGPSAATCAWSLNVQASLYFRVDMPGSVTRRVRTH